MAEEREAARVRREEQVAYKKPHFGPEETHHVVEDMTHEERMKKATQLNNLTAQMAHQADQRASENNAQRQCDRENLHRFVEVQNAEMQAQKEKIMNDKRKLKKAWEK